MVAMSDAEPSRDAARILEIARDGAPDSAPAPLDLGARVRALRRARSWTLEEAAGRAGLARSTLSKIENGQMSPTFDAVQKLAHGLGIAIPQLFTPPASERVTGRRTVTAAGAGRSLATTTYEHELLATEISAKRMLPYRTRVRARGWDDFGDWVRHDGEEFLLVLSGRIRLFTEFYEAVELGSGDSAYYDATMGHCVISVSDADAEILWVTAL